MKNTTRALIAVLATSTLLIGCSGGDSGTTASTDTTASGGKTTEAAGTKMAQGPVTVENCGTEVTFDATDKLFVNDGNIIATVLSAGGHDRIAEVSSLQRDRDILAAKYGADVVDGLKDVAEKYPSLEQIVAEQPDIYVAGWNYGLSDEKNITPDSLADRGIGTYILTEACRQEGSDARGIVDPWTAVETDLANMGKIVGASDTAQAVIRDQNERLKALADAPQPESRPVVFLFDSGTDAVFTSGRFGAPESILNAAGAENGAHDVEDTWVQVGWEKLAASAPDAFVFVEYPGQELDEKIELLRTNPVTRDLPAVKENRFINLPYAMWTAGPLNIDAAEHVRKGLEHLELVPASNIVPELKLPASVPGQEYFS
ncbi:ABC transporter substrate-binding protein [Corynebacterium sp. CCM 9185]|uniref:ABC transporter substrate-binding protein n=1 Tax=Corynebacterium marambiense TaxID=2765364 RepID=A0ABS0VTX6_9CORY|nr:ABC transporter substrate-binding protein [Corynebacterium marambiense]MBI9000233.1 ABC transporter substrate-binding protein [Corynebacterium marambiense]MCK7663587.1 ABC transporter substrate-binding protein [Corynebacterium marambiense]MCX7541979.1 ABC transporter substrate-binding protein [Corynebacterium marambiense]